MAKSRECGVRRDDGRRVREYVLRMTPVLGDEEILDLADLLHEVLRSRRARRRDKPDAVRRPLSA